MARVKKPVLATYKMVGYSPNHPMPIHVVGFLKEGERYVTTGMTLQQAEEAHQKLGESIAKARIAFEERNKVNNEANAV